MAHLIGLARLGRDAELRNTNSGEPVASLSLAIAYGRKDPNTNKRPTQWIDATLWGKRAESLSQYLLKGGLVSVCLDDVHIEEFEGRNGPGHKLAARVVDIELAGSPQQGQAAPAPAPRAPAPAPRAPAQAPRASSGFDDMDDDIPF